MFKISFFIHKKPEVSSDDFKTYWLGEHAELQKSYLEKIGVRSYFSTEVDAQHPLTTAIIDAYKTEGELHDFVDNWVFNDIEALKAGSQDPEVKAAMLNIFESEKQYIDHSRCEVVMSVDFVQFYSSADVRCTENDKEYKIYYCARALDGITHPQAQLHWNACHGAVSRQDIAYSKLSQYVQCHHIDSTFVEQLINDCGYKIDPQFFGHAEAFCDPMRPTPDFPQAEHDEVEAMSMDDIDLFANKYESQTYAGKDHYFIDKQVIVRPMPKFLSAVY